jgi:hypothetical protein
MAASPAIKNFLIADQVFRQDNGKWCIIGVFEKILAPSFPCVHGSLALFIQLSEAQGDYDVRLEFRDGSDRRLSALKGMRVKVRDRLDIVNFGIQTHGLPIPEPGRYYFKLFFNDELVGGDIMVEAHIHEGRK